MKKRACGIFTLIMFIDVLLFSQSSIEVGKGSFASYPPEATAYEDGYFAHPYKWFEQAWTDLNIHPDAKNRPIPTNSWWTEFIFRGLGREQTTIHQPPLTVTVNGNRFGSEAWAYPHMVSASANGFNLFYPKGFSGGGMIKGAPLKIHASTQLQSNDENILFADFESENWPEGWTVSNNTKNIAGPMATSEITQAPTPTGYVGNRFLNTFQGDDAQLTLISPKFTIDKNYIKFYVGGGNYPDDTYVGLFINGNRVLYETGNNGPTLTQRTWDVSEFVGQEAEIRIVDQTASGWGFIMCDEIIFSNSELGGSGYTADFVTDAANVYDWNDLGFTLKSEMANKSMDATITHGIPFVYFNMNGLHPILTMDQNATVHNKTGQIVSTFPATLTAFTLEFDNKTFGVHLPTGSKVNKSKGGDFQIEFTGDKNYVVVSVLPNRSFLSTYDTYARNQPGNISFEYEYIVDQGKIVTTFNLKTKNLDTGAQNQPTLMSFLPHHYRTTDKNFNFISGADYQMFIGKMQTGVSSSFSLTYHFGGMPPYLPEPLNLSQDRKERLNELLTHSSTHFGRNGNTYAKGFGEQGTMMLMAKSMDHSGFDLFKNALKSEFADWLTFDPSEKDKKSYYFAKYPNYGALIGFPPGYGSQGFNDLHFHNGYFTVGAARLMMVDKEFKRDYSEMIKLVTKTYANWERYEGEDDGTANYQPFLRTFDPYLGHSFAGGIGDGGGNNQESTSEAINSWFGVYMLGVEMNDKAIIDCGAMGYMLENMTAGEYWLNMYNDNFPPTYNHEYVGILRTDNLAWGTYFAGDPAWILGIQACPVDFYYQSFSMNPERMEQINSAMFQDRTTFFYDGQPMHTNADPYDNIKQMGPYLGGYHLNILNFIDPETSADWIEQLCNLPGQEGDEWRNHFNTTTNYYMSNAMVTYGNPAKGYHTSIPSGAVYKNEKGELTYLLYNATDKNVDVKIYKDGAVIETIKVGAGRFYNSRMAEGSKPKASILTYNDNDKMALNKTVTIQASATDKDGAVLWVDFYFDNELIGTSYVAPYEISIKPTSPGFKEIKVIATDNDKLESEPAIVNVEVLNIEQTPFGGRTPWNIPDETIYAVQFDEGGPEIACHDNELEMIGGDNYRAGTGVETENSNNLANSNIGWTSSGEWFEYTVNVTTPGVYNMSAQLSSAGGGALRIFVNGVDCSGSVELESTGSWADYGNFDVANIPLKEGKNIIRVMVDVNGFNLRSYKFSFLPNEKIPSEVNAGKDVVINLPDNSISLTASTKTYNGTTISSYTWRQVDFNNAAVIDNRNLSTINISELQQGTYIFEVTIVDSNGNTASDQVVVLVLDDNSTAVKNKLNTTTVMVYPNPFTDNLYVQIRDDNHYKRLRLYSAAAQIVIDQEITNQSNVVLNTSNLPRGYYFLTLISDENIVTKKIIK